MKKLPKPKKPVNKKNLQLERVSKNLHWIYLVIFGCSLSLLLVFISFGTRLNYRQPEQFVGEPVKSISSGKPLEVFVGNITGEQVTVAFISEKKGHACLYSLKDGRPDQRWVDDRGAQAVDKIHLISLKNLPPETEFQVVICSQFECDPNLYVAPAEKQVLGEKKEKDGTKLETEANKAKKEALTKEEPEEVDKSEKSELAEGDWYGFGPGFDPGLSPPQVLAENLVVNGLGLRLKTGPQFNINLQPLKLIFGEAVNKASVLRFLVQNGEGGPVSSQLLAIVGDKEGWSIDLANARSENWQELFSVDEAKATVTILRKEPEDETSQETISSFLYQEIKDKPVKID